MSASGGGVVLLGAGAGHLMLITLFPSFKVIILDIYDDGDDDYDDYDYDIVSNEASPFQNVGPTPAQHQNHIRGENKWETLTVSRQ